MEFEWDDRKSELNLRKHGLRLEIAAKVFLDRNRTVDIDARYDYAEERLVTIGFVDGALTLVIYIEDEAQGVVRIISARRANRRERERYGDG